MRPRRFWLLASFLALLTAGWGAFGYDASQEKLYRAALGQAKTDLAAGRLASPLGLLVDLAARRPADGEVAYYLAQCEEARNNTAAALAAWKKVAAGSPFATRAAVKRAGLLLDSGSLQQAKAILDALPRAQGPEAGRLHLKS